MTRITSEIDSARGLVVLATRHVAAAYRRRLEHPASETPTEAASVPTAPGARLAKRKTAVKEGTAQKRAAEDSVRENSTMPMKRGESPLSGCRVDWSCIFTTSQLLSVEMLPVDHNIFSSFATSHLL